MAATGAAGKPFKLAGEPAWKDGLDGKGDSTEVKGAAWVPEGGGQAAALESMDSCIGYPGSRLNPSQGTILFRFKPAPKLAESYATRHPSWTDFNQYKPPHSGFLVDDIGWRGAPKGSFSLVLDPAAVGNLSFGVWDGGKWHYVTWKVPQGWEWNSEKWYEVGFTWGPKGQAVLLDGEVKESIPDVVPVNSAAAWYLGQAPNYWPYGPHTMMGAYDDLRVYAAQPAW